MSVSYVHAWGVSPTGGLGWRYEASAEALAGRMSVWLSAGERETPEAR
jgi:hypothetical protein